jgi:hypothetical protein
MSTPAERLAPILDALEVDVEQRGPREWSIAVPCVTRGAVAVLVTVRELTVTLRAFIVRRPDRDAEGVYGRLLHKNLGTRHWRFAIDDLGDVFARADARLEGLDVEVLDGLLGELSTTVDEVYESIVRMGFEVPEGTEFGPPPGEEA